jgi:Ca2+-binding RTX toxin-like protein
VLYGGDGNDELGSDKGEDALYGGDGNDYLFDEVRERERDKLYCCKGEDVYVADKNDYVDSSCERTLDEVYAEGPN